MVQITALPDRREASAMLKWDGEAKLRTMVWPTRVTRLLSEKRSIGVRRVGFGMCRRRKEDRRLRWSLLDSGMVDERGAREELECFASF